MVCHYAVIHFRARLAFHGLTKKGSGSAAASDANVTEKEPLSDDQDCHVGPFGVKSWSRCASALVTTHAVDSFWIFQ